MDVLQLLPGSIDYPSLRLISLGLQTEGVRPSFASLHGSGSPAWASEAGIEVLDLGLESARRAALVPAIARLLRQRRPDIVHTHLVEASSAAALVSPFTPPKIVHTRHHLDEHWLIGGVYHRAVDRLSIRTADRVVAPSEALRDFLVASEGADRDKLDVVRPCFDFEALTPRAGDRESTRSELGLEDCFIVGCVSRFIPFKGHDDLLAAAAQLRDRIPDLRLLFVGPGPQEHVRAEASRLGLADRLVLTGPRTDLARVYAAMDVKVQPSHSENASQVVVEAMIAGTPVIATRVGGTAESVAPGAGVLVPPRAPSVLAGEVARLHADPAATAAMAQAGRSAAHERFNTAREVASQLACYQKALA